MTRNQRLLDSIRNRIERHQAELTERQKLVDGNMQELVAQRDQFAAVAGRIVESVIDPAIEQLRVYFDNAAVVERQVESDFRTVCKLAHTPRFPATVTLRISLLPGDGYSSIIARYHLDIFPALMEFSRGDEATFPIDSSDEAISLWVEEKILDFVDTYLLLETHPLYQKDNLVTDPICGMRISAATAATTMELGGHVFYFCSEVCKAAFQNKSGS